MNKYQYCILYALLLLTQVIIYISCYIIHHYAIAPHITTCRTIMYLCDMAFTFIYLTIVDAIFLVIGIMIITTYVCLTLLSMNYYYAKMLIVKN